MEGLSHDTGETVFLLRRVGEHAICIGRCDPVSPVRIFLEIGSAVPLYIGASPKILLAHMPEREREAYFARASRTDTGLKKGLGKLREEIEQMRAEGTAITIDEITPGVWACAAPIIEDGKVIAAMSVAGPAFRIDRVQRVTFQGMVRAAAAQVNSKIGEKRWPTQPRQTA
jgi:DNA-binding IclR family transcriptional regulator